MSSLHNDGRFVIAAVQHRLTCTRRNLSEQQTTLDTLVVQLGFRIDISEKQYSFHLQTERESTLCNATPSFKCNVRFSPLLFSLRHNKPAHLSSRGNLETVQRLVEHKASLRAADNMGRVALDVAEEYGRGDVARYLTSLTVETPRPTPAPRAAPREQK